ncbi:MAG: glycine cleavage T C-terminal barrel domain-containing protein [Phycisphaerales bacterium]
MLHDTPLRSRHEQWLAATVRGSSEGQAAARPGAATGERTEAEIEWIPYGLIEDGTGPLCEIVTTYGGEVESEYAAIRRGAGLIDAPQRGTIVLRGEDRRDLLDRLVTQRLDDMGIGGVREAFLLNRKGRIEADLLIVHLSDLTILDVDITRAAAVAEQIDAFIFGEDVTVEDRTAVNHRISVHGRKAGAVLSALTDPVSVTLDPLESGRIVLEGAEVVVVRRDQTGEPGLEFIVPRDAAAAVWERLLALDETIAGGRRAIRPCGWYAYNIARIEAGTPLFNVDFATDSLPHETTLLSRRVSFTKGCYPGQEVVARTEHLGRPKQVLVGLAVDGEAEPMAGTQVFERDPDGAMGAVIGAVTSSTPSPMRGLEPIAIATIRSAKVAPGGRVIVLAGGEPVEATIGGLVGWSGGEGVAAVDAADDVGAGGADAEAGAEANAEAGPGSGAKAEAEAEVTVDAGVDAEAEPKADGGAVANADAKVPADAGAAGDGPAPAVDAGSEAGS